MNFEHFVGVTVIIVRENILWKNNEFWPKSFCNWTKQKAANLLTCYFKLSKHQVLEANTSVKNQTMHPENIWIIGVGFNFSIRFWFEWILKTIIAYFNYFCNTPFIILLIFEYFSFPFCYSLLSIFQFHSRFLAYFPRERLGREKDSNNPSSDTVKQYSDKKIWHLPYKRRIK
jgi:hypothetical protein